jgi:peptide/nickel transport system permease protein
LTTNTTERSTGEAIRQNYVVRNFVGGVRLLLTDRLTRVAFYVIVFILLLGLFGQFITPYEYDAQQFNEDGSLERLAPPSADHWLGTTQRGEDVFSRVVYGAQPTVVTGLIGGLMIIGIGLTIGVTAGYKGGLTETILMRFTDFVYGVPLIPFAIVLIAFLGVGFWASILVIGVILWRGNARVLRSQVLQIKERPYIKAAKAVGASDLRIVLKHVLPNVASMAVLFFSLGIGFAIIFQAGLAFIGVSNPFIPSWGIMTRNAYSSGLMAQAPWWALPPGLLISITVLSTFLLGRGYERVSEGGADEDTAGV